MNMEYLSLSVSAGPTVRRTGSQGNNEKNISHSTADSRILVHKSSSTLIYRCQDAGIKVPNDAAPVKEKIQRLTHEHTVCRHLPPSCNRRKVKNVTCANGRLAMHFEWVDGITLREWVHNALADNQMDVGVRVRAALAIVETLCSFHRGGVIHNKLSPDNIILTTNASACVATFIDLSDAVIDDRGNNSNVDNLNERLKEEEFKNLGNVLNFLFRGEEPIVTVSLGNEALGHEERRKRGKHQIHDSDLPPYLNSMISTLLQSDVGHVESQTKYISADRIFSDLKKFQQARAWEVIQATTVGRLKIPKDMFYGRNVEMSLLNQMFHSSCVMGTNQGMAMISGCSGAGKTTLAYQIKKQLFERNGYFIEGKFEENGRSDTILASALNNFIGNVMDSKNDKNTVMALRWRIGDALGQGYNPLMDAIPNLRKLMMEEKSEPNYTAAMGTSRRLNFLLCKLLGSIACRSNPLVLHLDDLQRADDLTLAVIRLLMTDPEIKYFFFIGCYRDNEVNSSHPLTALGDDLQEKGVNFMKVKVGPLDVSQVEGLVSDALNLPPNMSRPLAKALHSKTGGIILFILNLLKTLNKEGLLWFSMTNRQWEFDVEKIWRKEIHDDAMHHIKDQMNQLPKQYQFGLKAASCLGSEFDVGILERAANGNLGPQFLERVDDAGYIQRVSQHCYKWTHDQIQQAAMELIPVSKRASFHLLLGSRLLCTLTKPDLKQHIFVVIENMNKGTDLIQNPEQRIEVASLNLEAGEKAIRFSAFHTASFYIKNGLSMLEPDSWEKHYNLSIAMHDAASEVFFVTGDFPAIGALLQKARCHSFQDELNMNHNYVRSLIAAGDLEQGFSNCVSILSQLGEFIPSTVTADVYREEVYKVKQLVRVKSKEELLSLKQMTNPIKLAAMQFYNHALSVTFISKPHHNPIIVFRMVRMTIEHGLCSLSPFAFGCYGAWLVCSLNSEYEAGYGIGKLALEMMDNTLGSKETIPRLYLTIYAFIAIWKEPFQATLDKHLEAYDVGVSVGDMEYGTSNLLQYAIKVMYGCGNKLEELYKNIQLYILRASQCGQKMVAKSLVILHQLVSDLMGLKQNSFSQYFGGLTENAYLSRENSEISIIRFVCVKQKFLAFFVGDMDTAAEMYELSLRYPTGPNGRLITQISSTFIDGLLAFNCARKRQADESKWTKVGEDVLQTMQEWAKSSEWNFRNKFHLLEAEHNFLTHNDAMAISSYNAAIKTSRDHKFIHEQGLSHEKFASYLLSRGNKDDALRHFICAKGCYENWGANALVTRLSTVIAMIRPMVTES